MDQKWGLRLVVDNTKSSADKLRADRLYNALCNTVWAWHSPKQAMKSRSFLLGDYFDIKWASWVVLDTSESCENILSEIWGSILSADKKAEILKEQILLTLKESWAIIRTSDIKNIVPNMNTKILSAQIADWTLRWELWEMTPEWEQLAADNLKKSYVELWDEIRNVACWVLCREELEYALRKKWFEIRNEALTKLMLLEINKWNFYPKVLVLPFDYKPYNPFVTLVDYDEPVYPELKALNLFAFLDEY